MGLECLQRWRLHDCPRQPAPVLSLPQSKEALPCAEVELTVSPSHAQSGDTVSLWGADCLPHHIQHFVQRGEHVGVGFPTYFNGKGGSAVPISDQLEKYPSQRYASVKGPPWGSPLLGHRRASSMESAATPSNTPTLLLGMH